MTDFYTRALSLAIERTSPVFSRTSTEPDLDSLFVSGSRMALGNFCWQMYRGDQLTGKTNRPVMIELVGTRSPVISGASSLAARFGPWGALLGTLGTLGFGLYARVRNRQQLKEAGLKVQARRQLDLAASALTFVVQLVEKIKEGGAIDADGNGKVSLGEVQEWVRGRGSRFKDPKFLAEVVRIANASLSPDDERRQLTGVLAGIAN